MVDTGCPRAGYRHIAFHSRSCVEPQMMMMMPFTCSYRNKSEPTAIYPFLGYSPLRSEGKERAAGVVHIVMMMMMMMMMSSYATGSYVNTQNINTKSRTYISHIKQFPTQEQLQVPYVPAAVLTGCRPGSAAR